MELYTEDKWINWVDTLANDDYLVIDDFLPQELFLKLRSFLLERLSEDDFRKAGIGASNEFQIQEGVRGDFVFWLDKQRDQGLGEMFLLSEEVKSVFNRLCYLSLSGYEFHLAHYPKGSYYKRHLDQFRERNNRMITMIIYLNQDWKKGDGGELKVYKKDGGAFLLEPLGNRCVIFRSDTLEHEVLITNKSRYSLTGWLLYQPSSVGYLLG
jgi:SM-20-related protein